jgi:organic radical activating enzyme
MKYPTVETFYSLQGEGQYTGTPAYFIRLAGCNLSCDFCDTDIEKKLELTANELVQQIAPELKHIVITGGEPFIHDLVELANTLHDSGRGIHYESNGTMLPYVLRHQDWLAISPKSMDISPAAVSNADEIKFLCGQPGWKGYIDWFLTNYGSYVAGKAKLWLMPLAHNTSVEGYRDSRGLIQQNIDMAVRYCLANPRFSLCLQQHKLLGIK